MAQVDLFDLLKLEKISIDPAGKSGINVTIINSGGTHGSLTDSIPAEDNLITRAVKKFCDTNSFSGSLSFHWKRIFLQEPVSAAVVLMQPRRLNWALNLPVAAETTFQKLRPQWERMSRFSLQVVTQFVKGSVIWWSR